MNAQEIELAEPGRTGLDDVWWLLRRPAALAGMSYPTPETDWEALSEAGVGVVLQLEPGEYDGLPLKRLEPVYLEDLVHGGPPQDPQREWELIHRAVGEVVRNVRSGTGVVVHCRGGIGRTGTVLACVLRQLGLPAAEALGAIERRRSKLESSWQTRVVVAWPDPPERTSAI